MVEHEEIMHFSFASFLPDEAVFAIHPVKRTIAYLTDQGGQPRMQHIETLTAVEMCVVLPLFVNTPSYCPHEVLYASLMRGNTAENTVMRCRKHLLEAQESGVWDQEIRPIRNAMSRARLKLRAFGIDVRSIIDTGYLLTIRED
jgi:hypothetical protein